MVDQQPPAAAAGQDRIEPRQRGILADFLTGIGFLLRGIGMYARTPRFMLLGLIPAALTGVLLFAAFAALVYFIDDISAYVTPYADGWPGGLRDMVRVVAAAAIVVAWVLLSVLLYTQLTLLVGQPFYEAISKGVEDKLGGVTGEINVSFWRTLPRTIVDNVKLIVITVVFGLPLLLCGLLPVVGETVVPVLACLVGGWVLAMELSSVAFERRGLRFRHRWRMLGSQRAMTLGFGVATFLCFLVPLGAVLVMPAAVAGATLLSRRLFAQQGA